MAAMLWDSSRLRMASAFIQPAISKMCAQVYICTLSMALSRGLQQAVQVIDILSCLLQTNALPSLASSRLCVAM